MNPPFTILVIFVYLLGALNTQKAFSQDPSLVPELDGDAVGSLAYSEDEDLKAEESIQIAHIAHAPLLAQGTGYGHGKSFGSSKSSKGGFDKSSGHKGGKGFKSSKGSKGGKKGSHGKKGSKGFKNVYHKEEHGMNKKFFSDSDSKKHNSKYDKFDSFFKSDKGGKKKGGKFGGGKSHKAFGDKGFNDKGSFHSDKGGKSSKFGKSSNHGGKSSFGKKGGHKSSKGSKKGGYGHGGHGGHGGGYH